MAPPSEGFTTGGGSLNERVEMAWWLHSYDDHVVLEAAVMLRGKTPNWSATTCPPDLPPSGSGVTVGRHAVTFDRHSRFVSVNSSKYQLNEFNVLLLDKADDPVNDPIVADTIAIDPYLSEMPPQRRSAETITTAIIKVEQRLRDHNAIQRFL